MGIFDSSKASGSGSTKPSIKRGAGAESRRKQIKGAQEQALKDLPQRKLYIVLWIRADPPLPNDFHWGFYYHIHEGGGIKYHITNVGNGWVADYGPTGGVFKSNFLCVLIQVATIPAERAAQLDQIMRAYDQNLNGIPNVTCRVWLFRILEILVQHGLVRCSSLQDLQAECMEYGNQHSEGAAFNNQPRPVTVSRVCN